VWPYEVQHNARRNISKLILVGNRYYTYLHTMKNSWAKEISLFISWYNNISSIKEDITTILFPRFDKAADSLLSLGADDWTKVGVWDMAWNRKLLTR
jgi:hypothetical protein